MHIRSAATLLTIGLLATAACGESSPAETVDSVVARISLATQGVTLQPGESHQLATEVLDQNGAPVSDADIEWTTDDPAVATVDDGRIDAVAEGTTHIHASVGAVEAAASVIVQAPASGGSLVHECSAPDPAWIWCDDFEIDRLSGFPMYFEYDDDDGEFVRTAGVGVETSQGMMAQFQAGEVGAGSLKLAFGRTPQAYLTPVDDGTADYREVFWRVFVRHEDGWIGGGGDKLSRATSLVNENWAQAMIAHVWSGGQSSNWDLLVIDPASGTLEDGTLNTTGYNDFDNLRWMGGSWATTPLFSLDYVGSWYCVETHVRLNDANEDNGVFRLWIDGTLEAERIGLNWVGAYDDYGINAVFLENYWNQGSAADQERYFDNFVVSTERIGCGPS